MVPTAADGNDLPFRVFPASEEDVAAAVKGDAAGVPMGGQPTQRHWVLRLRGMPFSAGPEQVLEFFGPEHVIIGGAQVRIMHAAFANAPCSGCNATACGKPPPAAAAHAHRAIWGYSALGILTTHPLMLSWHEFIVFTMCMHRAWC